MEKWRQQYFETGSTSHLITYCNVWDNVCLHSDLIVFKSGYCQSVVYGIKIFLLFTTIYTLFWAKFLRGLCSNSKDAKIKDGLRKILDNIVNVCFNQVTE